MNTSTIYRTSTMESLLNAYRSHVLGRPLPTPAVVTFYPATSEITIQAPGGLDLYSRLSNLLVWVYTLTGVTAEWWHTTDGALHVTAIGRTSNGTHVKVYGAGPFSDTLDLVTLTNNERDGVSLDELHTLLDLLRDAQHEREAA